VKVLGLDLSLNATGYCILAGERGFEPSVVGSGVLEKEADKTVEQRVARLASIVDDVLEIIRKERPDHVIIEAPAVNQPFQAAAIGEVHGAVKVQLYKEGIIPIVEQATAMRSTVVGRIEKRFEKYLDKNGRIKRRITYGTIPGKRGKPKRATVKDIIEHKLKERGLAFGTQDEMDAYVAARYCWIKLS
jgi:Holliday junction resolvasome RuvABC endonuclease subunit